MSLNTSLRGDLDQGGRHFFLLLLLILDGLDIRFSFLVYLIGDRFGLLNLCETLLEDFLNLAHLVGLLLLERGLLLAHPLEQGLCLLQLLLCAFY